MLTEAHRAQYARDGYVLLPDLVSAQDLDRYEARFIEFATGAIPAVGAMNIMRDIMVVKGVVEPQTPLHGINKMLGFEDDPTLFEYVHEPRILEAVRDLLGPEIYCISTNVFNKPPGVDGRHPLHQDLRYFRLRPADGIVGVWTAISPANRESGCLAVVPRSHKGPLHGHEYPDWEYVNHAFFGIEDAVGQARAYVEMAPGDTLLFHPLLIHGSGHNLGRDCRRAISVHYASGTCEAPDRDWRTAPNVRLI